MKSLPAIGDRVRYSGRGDCGPYTGTVTDYYPTYVHRNGFNTHIPVTDESMWHVQVRVETLPDPWPYPGTHTIAPQVADIEASPVGT